MPGEQKEKSLLKQAFDASMVGVHMVVSTCIGFFIGYGLDKLFVVTAPYLMFVFLVIGFIAGVRDVLRTVKKMDRQNAGNASENK